MTDRIASTTSTTTAAPATARPDTSHTDASHTDMRAVDDERSGDGHAGLDDLVHEGDVVMLTTNGDGHLTSRPLTVAGVSSATLLFLVDATARWLEQLDPANEVNASVVTGRNDWVSVSGTASVATDDEAIAALWSPAAGAYFDGADDPRIRVLQLHMDAGEYWSAPGNGALGRMIAVVSSALGIESTAGDHGTIG